MDDWEELFSESKQKPYWKNKATGEKTWKNPKGASTVAKEAAPTEAKEGTDPGSDEWEELFSEQKRRKYWKNKATGEKTWENPKGDEVTDPGSDEWEELFNEQKGKKYWKNKKTGEKTWKPPPNVIGTDAPKVVEEGKSGTDPNPTTEGGNVAATESDWVETKGKPY